ncbi:MAG: hypothetical protein NTY02_13875 [Acidobacteria bacterium]|nr:hypothetical protein [Acidobacteriota bacterium]
MTTSGTAAPLSKDAEKKIRRQLERVLASRVFQQVDRLKRFLSFIVLETLAGRRSELKEYVVGVQVFGKEESFDPRTDPVVRVQARRLRARLAQYYQEEGQGDEVVIDLPKGGYTPSFTRRDSVTHQRRSIGAALLSRNTVAVLPLADHSATDYFCRGVREEIIHRLASIGGLRVLAWDPAEMAGSGDPRESANRATVATVISGSVRTLGDKVRVTTQIVDGATGCYLWSESTDSHLGDAFGIQERVAQSIVRRIEQELIGAGSVGPVRRTTPNLAAQNLLLQGRYHLGQRTVESLQKAVEFFERALVEDAQYSLAHSGLSDAYSLLAHYGGMAPAEVWTKAASSAASAVMLDDNSAEAHTSLAHAKATQDWDWQGAEREFLAAIALDPRYATARHWYTTSCLTPLGRMDEALEQILLASALDPVSSIVARDVAVTYYYKKEFDQALEQCDHTIELNPHFSPAYWTLGLIQEQRKELDESIAAFQRAAHLSPRSPRMQAALARAYALAGKQEEAVAILHQIEKLATERYVSPFEFALVHFALGHPGVGYRWLSQALRRGMTRMRPFRSSLSALALTLLVALAPACTAARTPGPAVAPARAGDAVDIVVQGAVDSEVDPLVAALTGATRIQIASWTFWRGRLGGRNVVVSRTEVGPINAVAATTLAIRTFHPRLIINQGTAGAADPDLRVFDIIVGEATVDYGAFRTPHIGAGGGSAQRNWTPIPHRLRFEGDERVPLPVFPGDPDVLAAALAQPYAHGRVLKGIIGSAFQYNQEVDRLDWIRRTYGAISEDMESAYAAGAALGFATPFLAVRIISDSDYYAPGIHPDAAGRCATFVATLVGRAPLPQAAR